MEVHVRLRIGYHILCHTVLSLFELQTSVQLMPLGNFVNIPPNPSWEVTMYQSVFTKDAFWNSDVRGV
jgi:hypothetical protein